MQKKDETEKIDRYILGLSDENEISFVESLFEEGVSNEFLRNQLKKDWETMLRDTSQSDVNLNNILDRVHHIIRKNETLKRQKPMQKFIRIYMRAAAILLLPLLITAVTVYNFLGKHRTLSDQQVTSVIYAPLGARVNFNLPDGTVGMLNSGSKISYSLPFSNYRHVKLEGEAWLEVKHDAVHPFEISAGNSMVKVLGTSFNISAYPAENYIEVVLQQGKVEFQAKKDEKTVAMLPSDRLIFQNGNISKSVTDPAKYNAWTEGKLVLRGDSMSEAARRIERWYNIKIKLADKELEKYSFRATFQDDALEDVLRFLSMTSPIRYSIIPRKLMPDGTYNKEEVTIYLKKSLLSGKKL